MVQSGLHWIDLIDLGWVHHASDLHLSAGCKARYRIDGVLQTFHSYPLSHDDVLALIHGSMTAEQQRLFSARREVDYAFHLEQKGRLRVNAFYQERGASAAFRFIASQIKSFADLHLPASVEHFCHYTDGLVLVTGATGSGKSTTLTALIEQINQTQAKHILTLEDPIEFIYENKQSLIQQREIHRDTRDFSNALRMTLRQDPDVILLGEMRDRETVRLALEAAETGHVVFATLHASSAVKAIDRIVQIFPGEEQGFIRSLLANTLRAVVAQELVPKKGGGRVAVCEVMIVNTAISHLIRENKLIQIPSVIQTSAALGMQTRDQHREILKKQEINLLS